MLLTTGVGKQKDKLLAKRIATLSYQSTSVFSPFQEAWKRPLGNQFGTALGINESLRFI